MATDGTRHQTPRSPAIARLWDAIDGLERQDSRNTADLKNSVIPLGRAVASVPGAVHRLSIDAEVVRRTAARGTDFDRLHRRAAELLGSIGVPELHPVNEIRQSCRSITTLAHLKGLSIALRRILNADVCGPEDLTHPTPDDGASILTAELGVLSAADWETLRDLGTAVNDLIMRAEGDDTEACHALLSITQEEHPAAGLALLSADWIPRIVAAARRAALDDGSACLPPRTVEPNNVDVRIVKAALADVIGDHKLLHDQCPEGVRENYWPSIYDAFRRLWATLPRDIGLVPDAGLRSALRAVEDKVSEQFAYFDLHRQHVAYSLVPLGSSDVDDLRRLESLLRGVCPPPAPVGTDPYPHASFVFIPDGEGYFLKGYGESGRASAKGCKGLHQLYRLVQNAGAPVPMTVLAEIATGPAGDPSRLREKGRRAEFGDLSTESPSPLLAIDRESLQELKKQLEHAKNELARAERSDDTVDADHCREEVEARQAEINRLTNVRGQPRELDKMIDRLRSRIHGTIQTAGRALERAKLKEIGKHLILAIQADGDSYVYRPGLNPPITWVTTTGKSQSPSD